MGKFTDMFNDPKSKVNKTIIDEAFEEYKKSEQF